MPGRQIKRYTVSIVIFAGEKHCDCITKMLHMVVIFCDLDKHTLILGLWFSFRMGEKFQKRENYMNMNILKLTFLASVHFWLVTYCSFPDKRNISLINNYTLKVWGNDVSQSCNSFKLIVKYLHWLSIFSINCTENGVCHNSMKSIAMQISTAPPISFC